MPTLNRYLSQNGSDASRPAKSASPARAGSELARIQDSGNAPDGSKRPGSSSSVPTNGTKGMIYSHSRLATFEQCPLKFKLRYIEKIKPDTEQTIEAFMGSMVHEALEKLYKDLRFHKVNSVEDILGYYTRQWEKNISPDVIVVKKEYGPENYKKMGEDYIRAYYKRFHPFNQSRTVGLEERVMVKLDAGGRYRLRGFIDRLSHVSDGIYEIHDYKTNIHLKPQEALEEDRQLALYAIAVRQMFPDASNVKQIWHFLAHDKHMTVEKDEKDLENLKQDTIALIRRIEQEKEFPHKPSALCNWCEFRPHCPQFRHIAKTEGMEPNEFLKEPGVKLVNRYVELTERKKEIEEKVKQEIEPELHKVREALVSLAEKEGARVINGSNHTARVWIKDCYRFPGRDDPLRKDLEKVIRQSGIWDSVSSLDTFTLSKLLDSPPTDWPQPIVDAVRKMASRERIKRIYLSKPKDSD